MGLDRWPIGRPAARRRQLGKGLQSVAVDSTIRCATSSNFLASSVVASDDKTGECRNRMKAFLSNLTAVLLVIHAMIGCCHWHDNASCISSATISATPSQCCGHRHGSHDKNKQPAQPCNGEVKCQGLCSFLPSQKVVIDAPTSDAALDFASAMSTHFDGHLAAAAMGWDRAHIRGDSPPRLRLHLLHQHLLI